MNKRCSAGHWVNAGYTLTELAIAVTVSGVVLGGVTVFGARVWEEQRADAFGQSMVQLVQTVNAMFPGAATYEKLNVSSAIQLGVFSDELVNSAAVSVNHLYGQPLSLGGLPGAGFNNQAWGLHYSRLPATACLAILQYAIKLADAVAIVADPLGGGTATSFGNWGGAISWSGGAVAGFDLSKYQVIKSSRMTSTDTQARINACNSATGKTGTGQGSSFGLALVLRKL